MRNPFKEENLRRMFDSVVQAFETRHKDLFSKDGQPHRLNGVASPFWRGYYGEQEQMVAKNTPAHASFRAGQACQREYGIEFGRNGMTIPLGSEKHYPKTAAQRKQDERQRRREAGYVLVQEWCHRDDVAKLKELAAELRKKREASNA